MTETKTPFASRTVWANFVGLAALVLPFAGFDAAALDPERLAEAGATLVAAGSFIASTVFRVVATRRIGG
ncbi:hypothetical protein [Salinarimonas ramus]|uniref:Uncharacterized protein n=1 Tax=Salinarimonas ramus TaxID=690164 RepID=A0A917Q6X5_9HYPH|nr:hypothetical protein [Salinarimonas ramus]GGK29767.1 hypothetical protein GCM10011322_15270 [Salinarimonas ramus]